MNKMSPLKPSKTLLLAICTALTALAAAPALAEKADRSKPINIEADRMNLDDANRIKVFEGNVVLTQGTRQLKTNKLVVTLDADGFQIATATGGAGGLARIHQKQETGNDYFDGEAEKIVYKEKTDVTEFFTRAWIKNGQDEVRGQYVLYDGINEKYVAKNNGDTKTATGATQARVHAIIQPKGKDAAATTP